MLLWVLFVPGFEPQRYWFQSKLTVNHVSVSLSKPHHIPPNVEEGYNKLTLQSGFFTNSDNINQILHNNAAHYLLKIVSNESFLCHHCKQH
jgi:hypothetical protein